MVNLHNNEALTDAGASVLVQTETPITEAGKGAGSVMARVFTAAVHSQTFIYI